MLAYCKFLSANDTGETQAHQSGIYIAKQAIPILFDSPGIRGENKDCWVEISWQDDFTTKSRFIYYGQGTRNEYRITQFGRGFPFLRPEHTGDLFVLVKQAEENYSAYVLSTEDEMEEFLSAFGMSAADTGRLIERDDLTGESNVDLSIDAFIQTLEEDFPASTVMSKAARDIFHHIYDHEERIITKPDDVIIDWTEMEYRLFRRLEFRKYGEIIQSGFTDLESFINMANTVLNRRKSRAGKSLENHLSAIFTGNSLFFEEQVVTEGNKKPDFIFPGSGAYHDMSFRNEKLIFLGAKTTCKDRWRQVINEANRIPKKHLFTLQQGISAKQLIEMNDEGITLVVPSPYLSSFPDTQRSSIWTLEKFVAYCRGMQKG